MREDDTDGERAGDGEKIGDRSGADPSVDTARLIADDLKKLRTGRGLTPTKLEGRTYLLAALGNPSLVEAHETLVRMVNELGEGIPARALRAAYSIDMAHRGILKDRRSFFGVSIDRVDVGTIIGYEDDAIKELAGRLIATSSPGSTGMELVRAEVEGRVIKSVHKGYDLDSYFWAFNNKADVPSVPMLLVQYHRSGGQRLGRLMLAIRFTGDPLPAFIWTTRGQDIGAILIGGDRKNQQLAERGHVFAVINEPEPGWYYAICWQY